MRYILVSSRLIYPKGQDESVIGADTGNPDQSTKKSILGISSMCISGTPQASVTFAGLQEKCRPFAARQNLNRILTFRCYRYHVVAGGTILQRLDCRSLQHRDSPSVYSFLAPGLLWRETEVIGHVTPRIWDTRLAATPKQRLASLDPKRR